MEITKNEKIILRCNDVQKAIQYAEGAGDVLGGRTIVTDCVSFKCPGDLMELLTSLFGKNEVLLLYNIGNLDNNILEYLHGAILNNRVDIPIGDGKIIEMDINPFVPILLLKEEEALPVILNDINFKIFNNDNFGEYIKDKINIYFNYKRNGQKVPEDPFLFLCFSQKDQLNIYPLCKELDNMNLPYMINPISEFNGWDGIQENLSNIESAKLFMWVDSDNLRKDEYIADLIDYFRKIKDNSDIIEYDIDTPKESIKDFCKKIEKKLGLDSEGLLSEVESLLSKDCFDEAVELIDKARERGYISDGNLFKYAKICEDKGAYIHAKDLYEIAASNGYAPAQCNLGLCYDTGKGVLQNENEAAKWYRKAAEQGNGTAQYNLGLCYKNGDGVKQSYSEAIKWFLKSSASGYKDAKDNLQKMSNDILFKEALNLYEGKAYDKALLLYEIAANKGDASSMCNIGYLYANGYGVNKNVIEATKWYRKAAEQGNRRAQINLAYNYENGVGVNQDVSEAFKWYKEASRGGGWIGDQTVACARYNVARCYEFGIGSPKNISEAISWYKKAAEYNYKDAKEKADALIKENYLTNKIYELFK